MTFYKGNISFVTEKVITKNSTSTVSGSKTEHKIEHFVEKTFKLDGKTFLFSQKGTTSLLLEDGDQIAVLGSYTTNKNGYYIAYTIVNISKDSCLGGQKHTVIQKIFESLGITLFFCVAYFILAWIGDYLLGLTPLYNKTTSLILSAVIAIAAVTLVVKAIIGMVNEYKYYKEFLAFAHSN